LKKSMMNKDLRAIHRLLSTRKTHAGIVRETWRPGMLLLDIDGAAPRFPKLCSELRRLGLTLRHCYYARSSSQKHWHVVIWIKQKLPIMETIFTQLKLGSDPERERCNFIRAYFYNRSDQYVQILFERKLSEKEMLKLI
jgi:hypothetical protein